MHHRWRFSLQPPEWEVTRLYSQLARPLPWSAVDPVPITVRLIDYPVANGGPRNIDYPAGRNTEGAQHGSKVTREIFTPARDQPEMRLPEAHTERRVQAIATQTGHPS